jgi:hypothetical protein
VTPAAHLGLAVTWSAYVPAVRVLAARSDDGETCCGTTHVVATASARGGVDEEARRVHLPLAGTGRPPSGTASVVAAAV